MTQASSKNPRQLNGIVTSAKMAKTVVVAVVSTHKNSKYQKSYNVTTALNAHDESGALAVGDRVTIMETRPISKTKKWKVVSKLSNINDPAKA